MVPESFAATLERSDLGMVVQSRQCEMWVGLKAAITTQCCSWPCQVQRNGISLAIDAVGYHHCGTTVVSHLVVLNMGQYGPMRPPVDKTEAESISQ